MKKNGKWTPHIIAVTALVVFIVLGLACATVPAGPTPTYLISTKPVAAGTLKGKKAVIFNIEMADRESASLMERQGSGGIFSVIQGGARLVRLAKFNNSAKKFDKENEADVKEALKLFDELIATTWQKAYDAETVNVAYDFGKTKPKRNFFNKPKAALKKDIARICTENNAEFAVTIMQQITHGYMDEGSLAGTGRMIAITHITAEICVYDKKGNVIIQATAKAPNIAADLTFGYNFSPNAAEDYVKLYLAGCENILTTILAFDSSAAISSIEDLMEDLSIELATTEDAEDDK